MTVPCSTGQGRTIVARRRRARRRAGRRRPGDHAGRVDPPGPPGAGAGAAGRDWRPTPGSPAGRHHRACRASGSRRSSTPSGRCSSATGHRVAVLAIDPSSTRTGGSILGDKTRDGPPGPGPERLRPPVADRRHARRGHSGDARGDRRRRGGRLRRRARRDRRRRASRRSPSPRWSTRSSCCCWPAAAIRCRGSRRACWSWPMCWPSTRPMGRTAWTPSRPPSSWRARCTCWSRRPSGWSPPVLTCSAVEGTGLAEVWQQHRGPPGDARAHRPVRAPSGPAQQVRWMWQMVQDRLRADLEAHRRGPPADPRADRPADRRHDHPGGRRRVDSSPPPG